MNDARSDELIAIVGMACRFPGAGNLAEYWANLRDGRESVAFLGDDELRATGVTEAQLADPRYVRAYASATGIDMFDAGLFGFTPRDATNTDPQIRLFLETCHTAVENAGYDPDRMSGSTAVYGATGHNRYAQFYLSAMNGSLSSGRIANSVLNMPDYLATLVSYKLGFTGPSMTVLSACSSSLVAVHLGAQALRVGECDVVVAGGTDVLFPVAQGYQWDDGSPVSPDGHCRPFDADARGTLFSTGAGAVVLKRLDDALADRDEIVAVLRGSAVNNDGASKAGFTAPGVIGQADAVREAMLVAGVTPADISYVEAHGTGTSLGDPVEISALAKAYEAVAGGPVELAEPIPVSSVKGNIGHLGHAAGIASLIKVVLCLANEQRAGTVNFTEPNPRLNLDRTPFMVTDRALPWPRVDGRPRVAGISALGFGGTNAHLIVEEGPLPVRTRAAERARVLPWSGRTGEAVDDYRQRLAEHLSGRGADEFADLAGTLQDGRTGHRQRRAVVAAGAGEALTALAEPNAVISGETGRNRPSIAFLFPGQAAQAPRMAAGLYGADPAFTATLDTCFDLFSGHGFALAGPWRDADAEQLADTRLAQPLLFAVEYALARMWQAWGIEPAAVLGHSIGELVAATVAGVFDLPTAIGLVAARARAMADAPAGGMLAVGADEEQIAADLPAGVCVAVVNGPRQTVLAGTPDALAQASVRLRAKGFSVRELSVSHAFHSPLMATAADAFGAAFAQVAPAEPVLPLVSSAAGRLITAGDAKDPAFWAGQLAAPVRFDRGLSALLETGSTLLIEVGPGHTLTQLARAAAVDAGLVPTLGRGAGDDHRAALAAAANAWVRGAELDWSAVRGGEVTRRIPVPGYPYQRSRHWPDEPARQQVAAPVARPEQPAASPFSTVSWVELPVLGGSAPAAPSTAVVLLPADDAAVPVAATLQQAGHRLIAIRPGPSYRDDEYDLRFRPEHPDDLTRLLDTLAARGIRPDLLVHALCVGDWSAPSARTADEQLELAFHLPRLLARHAVQHAARVLVLASRSVDITGAEAVDPVKAVLHGVVRTLVDEAPELGARLIDVAFPAAEDQLAREIEAGTEPVIALRGPSRWARLERPLALAQARPPLRRNGVYLLTGGLGGLGRSVARALAGTGLRPNLVLVGRTGQPADERANAETAELTALGAQVRVEQCDIADRRALRRLVDKVKAHLGPIHGVVHLAGVAGDGMLVVRERADADAVLRPKVHGSLVLAEVLAGEPALDFYLAFSSRAALGGLVGGADYAAANAFLDAHTRLLARDGVPARTVNWPAWREVGMAVADSQDPDGVVWRTVVDPATDPVLDEHRVDGVPVLPGTSQLDLALRAFRAAIGPDDALVRFSEVVFRQVLSGKAARQVRVVFRPEGDGWRWETDSTAADGTGRIRHVTGKLTTVVGAPPAVPPLAELRARIADVEPPAPPSTGKMFALGPRWQNIARASTAPTGNGMRERLLDLVLPEAFHGDLAAHPLHPTMLDSATAAARDSSTDGAYVPFHYGELAVYAELPARCVSHVVRRPAGPGLIVADVTVYDPDGRVLAVASEFTMRAVADAGFAAPGTPKRPPGAGIEPAEGGRLFLTALAASGPAQVVVRPQADGKVVALAETSAPIRVEAAPMVAAPVAAAPVPVKQNVAPARDGSIRDRLGALWAEVLGVPAIDGDEDFFDLGGNSLVAVELISRVRDDFGVAASIVSVFENPTLAGLATALTEQGAQ